MGGDDSINNLIELSIEDHYNAHVILSKCFDKEDPFRRSNLASSILIKRGIDNPDQVLEYCESLKGKGNPNYGNKWTDEQRRSLSNKITKIWSDIENLKKIMKPKKDSTNMGKHDKNGEKNPFYGKTHSEETRKILSEKRKGKKPSNIKQVMINNIMYGSISEASRQLGIGCSTILWRINSKNKRFENYQSHPSIKAPLSN
jgi:hypothetical protein